MPGLTGDMGMEAEGADHRRASLPELQLPQRECDDIHLRNRAVRQSRHDAAVPADAGGLHVHACWVGAFRWGTPGAVSHARGWDAYREDSSTLLDRFRLAGH